jgi:predicted nucleic acid-binding protein
MKDDVRPAAVLDTNVLFPPSLRDTMIYAAEGGLFRIVWSAGILEELRRNLVRVAGLSQDGADRRVRYMDTNFPEATVSITGVDAPELPDSGDRHVLAAAMAASAPLIVTQNLKHFPAGILDPLHITAMDADAFLIMLLTSAPGALADALQNLTTRLSHPPMDVKTFLDVLAPHTPGFAEQMRAYLRDETA